MNPTDRSGLSDAELSANLFDEMLRPLAETKRRAGDPPYFPAGRDASVASYFETPCLRAMSDADFVFPGRGTARGLVDALVVHWAGEGEPALAAMGSRLGEIADALDRAAVPDGSVDIFCYTLF
jgi:hypothetical protein